MSGFFDLDAPIWSWMNEIADIIILSVMVDLWVWYYYNRSFNNSSFLCTRQKNKKRTNICGCRLF